MSSASNRSNDRVNAPKPPSPGAVLTGAVNHLLANEGWARNALAVHRGRVVRFDLAPFTVDVVIEDDGRLALADDGATPDTTLSLPAARWSSLLIDVVTGERERAMLRHARIEGDAELANAIATVARHLRFDVEDELAAVIGDIGARRVVSGLEHAHKQLSDALRRGLTGLADGFGHETSVLVARAQGDRFADDVRAMRDDLARLEKRIEHLHSRR